MRLRSAHAVWIGSLAYAIPALGQTDASAEEPIDVTALEPIDVDASDAPLDDPPPPPEPDASKTELPDAEEHPNQGQHRGPAEVTILGNRRDTLRRVPGTGTRISPREIESQRPATAGDALALAPGISVRETTAGGQRLDLSVRGIDAPRGRRILILEDGVPLAVNPYGEPDLYYSPPFERVRSVEVLYGAGGLMHGPQTIGGVVNFRTHSPPPRLSSHVAIQAGYPLQGRIVGRFGDSPIPDEIGYVAQISQSLGENRRDEGYQSTDAYSKVRIRVSDRSTVSLKISGHVEDRDTTSLGLTREMFEADPFQATLAPDDNMHIERFGLDVVYEHDFDEDTSLRVLSFGAITNRLWNLQLRDRAPLPGNDYTRVVGDPNVVGGAVFFLDGTRIIDREYGVLGLEPQVSARFETGPMEHEITAGVRGMLERAERVERTGERADSIAGSTTTFETGRTLGGAAYVVDEMLPSDWLVVRVGARLEGASQRRTIHRAFVQGVPTDVSVEGSTDWFEFLPGAGMVLGSKVFHGFSGVHTGFAPPRRTTAVRNDGVDAQLDSERSIHYELGFRTAPLDWLQATAAGYYIHFTNQVIPSTAGDADGLVSAGRTRHVGFEGALDASTSRPTEEDPWEARAAIRGSVGYAAFRDGPFAGNELPYSPRYRGVSFAGLGHKIGVKGRFGVTFTGPQFGDEGNTRLANASGVAGVIDPYATLRAGLSYQHERSGLGVDLSIEDILDRSFVVLRRPDGIIPNEGRRLFVELSWDYEATAPEY